MREREREREKERIDIGKDRQNRQTEIGVKTVYSGVIKKNVTFLNLSLPEVCSRINSENGKEEERKC